MPETRSHIDPPPGIALREAKLALRRQILALRDAMPAALRAAASEAIASGIRAHPGFASARTVLLTLPFRNEWDTLPLVRDALAAGKTVAMPRVDAPTRMLVLHAVVDADRNVVAGYQGIPEPLPECPLVAREAIDFVLVPGVAFDREGRRLGYGGGYYDRLLPQLAARAVRVAGAFDLQLVARVPAAPHDVAVDAIVTESGVLAIRR
jgi:5-formyltetrahydrofolate cyclo-ligase